MPARHGSGWCTFGEFQNYIRDWWLPQVAHYSMGIIHAGHYSNVQVAIAIMTTVYLVLRILMLNSSLGALSLWSLHQYWKLHFREVQHCTKLVAARNGSLWQQVE